MYRYGRFYSYVGLVVNRLLFIAGLGWYDGFIGHGGGVIGAHSYGVTKVKVISLVFL